MNKKNKKVSGTKLGSLKAKLGLKGKTKPGAMISAMNKIKAGSASGVGRLQKAKVATKKVIKKII